MYDWTNDMQLLYGNVQNKRQSMRKNADRIFLESKFAYRLSKNWSAFGSVTFMSQFAAGFEYFKLKTQPEKNLVKSNRSEFQACCLRHI
jgi:hypothetical protein